MKVLFVCLGNICRSPLAEEVFRTIVNREIPNNYWEIDSAGTAAYHCGNSADPRMISRAKKHGYTLRSLARQVNRDDFNFFNFIIAQDEFNFNDLKKLQKDSDGKALLLKMTDFLKSRKLDGIPDPYYGGAEGFEEVIELVEECSENLFEYIQNQLH